MAFSLSRVAWKDTCILSIARAVAAGIAWFPIVLALTNSLSTAALVALILPIQYFVFLAPFGVFCALFSRFIPFIGLVPIVFSIIIVAGDPIIYCLNLYKPGIVPMISRSPFNFVLVMYVLKS